MKIIDAHTHIFSPEIIRNRDNYLSDSSFSLLYTNKKSKTIGHTDLLKKMDSAGIEFAVVLGFPWENSEFRLLQNEYLAESKHSSGGRLLPFASIPHSETCDIDTHIKSISSDGFNGVGEIAFYSRTPEDREIQHLKQLLNSCANASLPVAIHVSEPVGHNYPGKTGGLFSELIDIIRSSPETKVILAHWGGGLIFYELMPEIASILKNTWYDTAASPFLYDNRIYRAALDLVSQKKILFGSDYPLIEFNRYLDPITTDLPPDYTRDILFNNSASLFNISE